MMNERQKTHWYSGYVHNDNLHNLLQYLVAQPNLNSLVLSLNYRKKDYILGLRGKCLDKVLDDISKSHKNPFIGIKGTRWLEFEENRYAYIVKLTHYNPGVIHELLTKLHDKIRDLGIVVAYHRREGDNKNAKTYLLAYTHKENIKHVSRVIKKLGEESEYTLVSANILDITILKNELIKCTCIHPIMGFEEALEVVESFIDGPIYLRYNEIPKYIQRGHRSLYYVNAFISKQIDSDEYFIIKISDKNEGSPANLYNLSRKNILDIIDSMPIISISNVNLRHIYNVLSEFITFPDIYLLLYMTMTNINMDSHILNQITTQLKNTRIYTKNNNLNLCTGEASILVSLPILFNAIKKAVSKCVVIEDRLGVLDNLEENMLIQLLRFLKGLTEKVVIATSKFNPLIMEASDYTIIAVTNKYVRDYIKRRYGMTYYSFSGYILI